MIVQLISTMFAPKQPKRYVGRHRKPADRHTAPTHGFPARPALPRGAAG
jgi:hypothetical protein